MNIEPLPNRELLAIAGVKELHSANWRFMVADITRLFETHKARYIEMDLSELGFIDSYGLGSLIALNRIAQRRDGNLRVKNPSGLARSLIDLTRMHWLIASEDPKTEKAGPTVPLVQSCTPP